MRKKQADRLINIVISLIALIIGNILNRACAYFPYLIVMRISTFLSIFGLVYLFLVIIDFLFSNKIYKGLKYFFAYYSTKNLLEHQFLDAGFKIQRSYYIEIPFIKSLSFSDDIKTGQLIIRNTLKFDRKLDDINLSAGLGRYIVERHYPSDDGNYYVFELLDGSLSYKMRLNDIDSFIKQCKKVGKYMLFLDGRTVVKLQHILLVGMTGAGKTYALYSLIIQLVNMKIRSAIYFVDPKGSSLAVVGEIIDEEHTYVEIDEIVHALESFVSDMRTRKKELKALLKSKVDSDYSDFQLKPHIMIFDEYAAFSAVIASKDKQTRETVRALMHDIALQGRQLGFFVWIVMQKSDASLIDTSIREIIPLKIVLGNSETQTYVTAFGASADVPNRHYRVGEGVFTEPTLAPEPKLVQFPHLGFDILEACRQSPRGVTTGAPEKRKSIDKKEGD